MIKELTFEDYMRAGQVKRWHIVDTARTQTMAEHAFLVTIIALELYMMLKGTEDWECVAMLTHAAMFHDMPEVITGDTPTPAKALLGTEQWEELDRAIMPKLRFLGSLVPEWVRPYVKMADQIESAWFIHQYGIGAHAWQVANRRVTAMQELAKKLGWENVVQTIWNKLNLKK